MNESYIITECATTDSVHIMYLTMYVCWYCRNNIFNECLKITILWLLLSLLLSYFCITIFALYQWYYDCFHRSTLYLHHLSMFKLSTYNSGKIVTYFLNILLLYWITKVNGCNYSEGSKRMLGFRRILA